MTTIWNQTLANFGLSTPYAALADGMAVVVTVLVLVLLIEKVLLDTFEGKPVEYKTRAFAITIFPLLFAVVVIGVLRIMQILKL